MKRRQAGFTLIELMVALVISSLLVGMILAIFSRMSMAYRGQQQIAGVQQVLSAARAQIEFDAKQAGFGMSQGFSFAGDLRVHQAVRITNNNAGPDVVAFFYGDSSTQAAVTGTASWSLLKTLDVDSPIGFKVDDIVILSVSDLTSQSGLNSGEANIAKFTACALQISSVVPGAPGRLSFRTALPWGRPGEPHCPTNPPIGSMIYKLVAHAYRIDTSTVARAAVGPLQMSSTGGLLAPVGGTDVWDDQAFGFTDLQTSLQVFDRTRDASDTPDPDTDGDRDWYSDNMQDQLTANDAPMLPGTDCLRQISISLVARTDRDVEGISTPQTPMLTDLTNISNNTIGDRASINLPAAPPWLADPALQGARIYRYTTFQVDFRNLGVGR